MDGIEHGRGSVNLGLTYDSQGKYDEAIHNTDDEDREHSAWITSTRPTRS